MCWRSNTRRASLSRGAFVLPLAGLSSLGLGDDWRLAWFRLPWPASPPHNAFEEICDIDLKDPRYVPEPTRRDAVNASFVFLNLLGSETNGIGKLLLGHAQCLSALTNTPSDMSVNLA